MEIIIPAFRTGSRADHSAILLICLIYASCATLVRLYLLCAFLQSR